MTVNPNAWPKEVQDSMRIPKEVQESMMSTIVADWWEGSDGQGLLFNTVTNYQIPQKVLEAISDRLVSDWWGVSPAMWDLRAPQYNIPYAVAESMKSTTVAEWSSGSHGQAILNNTASEYQIPTDVAEAMVERRSAEWWSNTANNGGQAMMDSTLMGDDEEQIPKCALKCSKQYIQFRNLKLAGNPPGQRNEQSLTECLSNNCSSKPWWHTYPNTPQAVIIIIIFLLFN